MANPRPQPHSTRQLAGSLADATDDLASWLTGHKPGRGGLNGLLSWITGHEDRGNSIDELASWLTGRRPR